jgi:hypothetical protein
MARYKIWDKTSDIYTPGTDTMGNNHWTAEEYIKAKAPWAAIPGVKVIVGGGVINGTVFMEYEATVEFYKQRGAEITDEMTDEEVLAAIEYFEDNPPVNNTVSAEERIAAALEYQVMSTLPDEEV